MKIQDLTVSKEMDISEMSAVHGGEANAGPDDPISYVLYNAAMESGPYGVISAASQFEFGVSSSNPKGVCVSS